MQPIPSTLHASSTRQALAAHGDNECKDLLQRREWCHLSSTCLHLEKADYIEATVKHLQSRPPLVLMNFKLCTSM
jgi:hypothetical protein